MTLKNTHFCCKTSDIFAEKIGRMENILTYFQEFSAEIFRFWYKKRLILQDLEKFKKKCQNGKFVTDA